MTKIPNTNITVHTYKTSGPFVVHRPVNVKYVVAGGSGGNGGSGGEVKTGVLRLASGVYTVKIGKRGDVQTTQVKNSTCKDVAASCRTNTIYGWNLCSGEPQIADMSGTMTAGVDGESTTFATVAAQGGRGKVDETVFEPTTAEGSGFYGYYSQTPWPASWFTSPTKPHDMYYKLMSKCTASETTRPYSEFQPVQDSITGTPVIYGTQNTDGIVIISYDEGNPTGSDPNQPGNLQSTLNTLRSQYESLMQQLTNAREQEVAAINDQNAAQLEEATQEQQRIIDELEQTKSQYDATASYLAEMQQTLKQNQDLVVQQSKQVQELEEQIKQLEEQKTATPMPTQPGTLNDSFGTTIYVILDADAWNQTGELRALTMNDGIVKSEPFVFRNLRQTWIVSSKGRLRSLYGSGDFVATADGCLVPKTESDTSSTWTFKRFDDHRLHFSLFSNACGRRMEPSVSDTVVLTTSSDSSGGWFVVNIGKAS